MIAEHPQMTVTSLFQITPRILIVDDDMTNRQLLARLFMRSADIVEAENGQQTLDLLASEPFDMVLLDVMMPDISGFDVLKTIRSTPGLEDLPVILITSLSRNDEIVYGLQCGANDYLTKPIDVDVVMARVNAQINMKTMMDVYKQSIVELEAAQKMKDRLLSIASHDLKSPLANIRMAEVLLRQFVDEQPTALEILDTVALTVSQMKDVIEEFLDLAACQSGHVNVHFQPTSIEDVTLDVVSQHSMNAFNKDIKLEVGQLVGTAYADPARLGQAVSNLVSNAIKYSPRNTTATIWSEVDGDVVRILVADQGPGIPPAERDRLFTEFGKLSTRPTGDESSTGLGLWIVKHMMTLQNGAVGVDCPPDGGSIFWVELPALAVSERMSA